MKNLLFLLPLLLFGFCQKPPQKVAGDTPPKLLMGLWKESFEEHEGTLMVYRPIDFEFPPARGRSGWEFLNDGTVYKIRPGAADLPEKVPGTYTYSMKNRRLQMKLTEEEGSHAYRIVSLSSAKLVMEKIVNTKTP